MASGSDYSNFIEAVKDLDLACMDRHLGGFNEAEEKVRRYFNVLYPPKAKPLQWIGNKSSNYRIMDFNDGFFVPQIRNTDRHVISWDGISCSTVDIEEARKICEDHHQKTYREMSA